MVHSKHIEIHDSFAFCPRRFLRPFAQFRQFLVVSVLNAQDLEREFTDAESRWLEVGGMRFHYKLEGNPNAKHSIVLVHGTSSSLHTWDDWTRELIKNDYKVLRMDTLGMFLRICIRFLGYC